MIHSLIYLSQDYTPLLIVIMLVILALLSPAIILIIISLFLRKKNPQTAKILFIVACLYVLIGLGICGIMVKGG